MDEKERYYSLSLLRILAYDDDVNGNCDGKIDFTVIDCISGADVAPRAEVAREILEEVRNSIFQYIIGERCFDDICYALAELEKKYMKNCTTCKHMVSCEPNPCGICDEYK